MHTHATAVISPRAELVTVVGVYWHVFCSTSWEVVVLCAMIAR